MWSCPVPESLGAGFLIQPPSMLDSHHRSCRCGAVYSRAEAMAPTRQIDSFECSVCGATLESWNTAWVPSYRLIAGPVRHSPSVDDSKGVKRTGSFPPD
jgi:hypothetical protein